MQKFWKSISAIEAKELLKQKSHDGDFCVLDVRTEKEFLSGAIPGALDLDFYAADFSQKLDALNKNKIYLIYCRTGSRSKAVLSMMKQLGFRYVYELDGGYISL
ncbi:MAG: rhodanese-like domain-containing protein [Candidatus Moranbacteria bacterium]|nr:rhodanese-like domain-containing protein [Candidatus Moranbacteria bacterium]